jgi:hypothetical protein
MSHTNLIYSTDGITLFGITWNVYTNIIPNNVMSNLFKIFFLFNNIMITGGLGSFQVGYSSDQGKTWIGSLTSLNILNLINDIATEKSIICPIDAITIYSSPKYSDIFLILPGDSTINNLLIINILNSNFI